MRAATLTISTFHSFALRLLRDHGTSLGYRRGFGIADDEDGRLLLRTALRELGISEREVSPKWGRWVISRWKNAGLDAEAAADAAADDAELKLALAYRKVDEEMRRRQVVDFDDMMMLAARLLGSDEEVLRLVRDRYRYLMVDEYQDTNRVQFDIVKAIAGGRRNVAVVGDDDQSIYGWRGAESGLILSFAKHFPGAKVVTLDQNYRSTNRILRAANAVIGNNTSRLVKTLWSALGEGDRLTVYEAADERAEMNRLVAQIEAKARDGVPHRDIAVLFRANAQSNAIEVRLRERAIPYEVVGTWSLFDRREVKDLLAYLKVLANPRDDGALMRVINRPSRGIGPATRDRMVEAATERRIGVMELIASGEAEDVVGPAAPRIAEFRELMAGLAATLDEVGLRAAFEALTERIGYRAFLEIEAADPLDAQVRWNVVESLFELAARNDARGRDALAGFLERLALDQKPDDGAPEEPTGVTLLTVHSAKGLEFPHVFIVGVEESLFPHRNSVEDEERPDGIDEERRLFYVAVTRARETLHLSWAKERTRYGKAQERERSRFIAEMDSDDVEYLDAASEGPADDAAVASFLSRLKGKFSESD
ncbi:MAG: 3'-5' exonuclease [Planctomycetota bacterium]